MRFIDPSWAGNKLAAVWGLVVRVPPFCWFSNDVALVLAKPDGQLVLCQAGQVKAISVEVAKRSSFWALELPEDLVLVRELTIPVQNADEKATAISLAVEMSSPFALDDCVWGGSSPRGSTKCVVAMASRKHIQAYARQYSQAHGLAAIHDAERFEMWFLPSARGAIVLSGFAEGNRSKQIRRNKLLAHVFLGLSLLTTVAILVTPLAQLALKAESAYTQLQASQAQTRPAQALREAMLSTQTRLAALSKISRESPQPPEILARVTAVVPDDTWVQRLQWQAGKVTLQGQTPNVAVLMAALSQQPDIKEVKAPSAATKAVGSGKENFTIEFILQPPPDPLANTGNVSSQSQGGGA